MTARSVDGIDARQRSRVIYLYAILAFLSLFIFGLLQIWIEQNDLVGYLELAGAGAVLLIILGFKATGNIILARFNFLLTIIVMLVVMITTGGTAGTGIFWCFMFPVAAFFLAGKRAGVLWMVWLFVVMIALWLAAATQNISIYYSNIEMRQLCVTLFVVSLALYVYQRSRQAWEDHARKSERELKTYLKQMAALHAKVDHAKSEFVTLTSHQLRTPISAIGWSSEMMLSGDIGKLSAQQREYIQGIYDSNRRLRVIVDAMLLVSSLELGTLYIRPEPTDLPALVSKILKEEVKKVSEKGLVVSETLDKIPKIPLDPQLINQIIYNLLSNAVKYTPANGTIEVNITESKEKLLPKSKGSIVITISDNGYGIPEDEKQNVFAKLFRAANIKTKDVDGTGLGLYIVKAILDEVGGKISFVSEENKGSTFVVALPIEGMTERGLGSGKTAS